MMFRVVCVGLMMAAVAACSVTSGNRNLKSEADVRATLSKEAPITKEKIIELLGEPNLKFQKDGYDVFEYKNVRVSERPASYIFLIGLFVSGYNCETKNLFIRFDKKGNMVDYKTIYDSYTGKRF